MNYIHNKLRDSLSVERANKLQFIYMNSDHALKRQTDEEIDNELLEWEKQYGWFYRQD
jgi:hypothetical protein